MTSPIHVQATFQADNSSLNTCAQLAVGAGVGWIVVAISGVWEAAGWDWPYPVFSITLLLAAMLSVAAAWTGTRETDRAVLRGVGLVVGVLALASTVVAWAYPLWMTSIAISFAVWAVVAPRALRPGLATLAAAQLVGMGAMIVAITAELGEPDSYGDYPAAFGVGLVVTALGSALGLALLVRSARS